MKYDIKIEKCVWSDKNYQVEAPNAYQAAVLAHSIAVDDSKDARFDVDWEWGDHKLQVVNVEPSEPKALPDRRAFKK